MLPVMVKAGPGAAVGHPGRRERGELEEAVRKPGRGGAAFGEGSVYLEKFCGSRGTWRCR